MLILYCDMRWIRYQLVTGCKYNSVSWDHLLCNTQREIFILGIGIASVNDA